jgi:divalent metal cation (Fe/Co/Zn/Cd) transporter
LSSGKRAEVVTIFPRPRLALRSRDREDDDTALLRLGLELEGATLAWNVVGTIVLLIAALSARSVALAGFGLDSLIEIFASIVVVWQLRGGRPEREAMALRLIGVAFLLLALYISAQSIYTLSAGTHPRHSLLGLAWLAVTAAVMFGLAFGKGRVGRALGNRILETESRVTFIDGSLAVAVLIGVLLNTVVGWWWADPLAGLVIVFYGLKEGWAALRAGQSPERSP